MLISLWGRREKNRNLPLQQFVHMPTTSTCVYPRGESKESILNNKWFNIAFTLGKLRFIFQ